MKSTAISKVTLLVSLLGLAAGALPVFAQTAPGLMFSDDAGNIITVNSQGAPSYSGNCATAGPCTTIVSGGIETTGGQVIWTGTIGNFSFTATGQTAPLRPGIVDINLSTVQAGPAAGTLTAQFTVNNIDGEGPYTMNQGTNFVIGSGSVTYTSYADATNTPFGTGSKLGTIGPVTTTTAGSVNNLTGPASHAMSITDTVVLTVPANSGIFFSTDFYTMNSSNNPLSLSCASGTGVAGVSYSSMLTASGGVPSYVYSIIGSSPLPLGLSLNSSTGAITGTPSAQGSYPYTAQVTDSSGATSADTVTASCSIVIKPPSTPLTLSCPSGTGELNVAYNSNLSGTGGTGKCYYYSTLGLPSFFGLNASTGFITGTPTSSGSFTYTASVTDTGDTTEAPATASCTVVIAPPPSMTCSAVNSGTIGTPWPANCAPTVTGGTLPYTFSYKVPTGSSFPAGLSVNTSTGAVTGTPTSGGTFAIFVTDKNGVSASSNCTINVPNAITVPPALSLTCPLSTATAGAPYSSTVVATGGVPPYTYALAAGSFPAGLTLSPTGVLSGTPSGAGTSGFTIKVTDSKGTVATSTCTGTCATATASVNFNSPTGNLGTSHAYTVSGTTVTAYGYTNSGTATGIDGQNNYGVQNDGLGITSTWGGQIDTNNFVQLDFTKALAAGATNGQISISGINQCQNGESYDIYGSNTQGSIGIPIVSAGTKDSTLFAIPSFGTYKYISVRAHSGSVLIAEVSFSIPGTTCSITVAPAPAPKVSIKKTANVSKVNPFQSVTYTYVVTNTGALTLNNVVVTDDNATPSYTGDDFQAGTIASLAPGASVTFTKTLIPPVSEGGTTQSWNGWGNNSWGGNNWGGNNTNTAGTLICSQLSNGNYQIVYRQDPSQTDNTYGRGSSSNWGGQQRNFSDMLSGQAAEFKFLDAKGNTVLDVATDYISQSKSFPSGYGTLGISGGNGTVISGSGSHVISCDTTLSHNLNQSSSFYKCTQDSPSSSSWDNVSGYTIVVDGKTFGSAGWGGVAIPECHNQNSAQWGCNDQKVSPVSSSSTNTATVTATATNGAAVSATATATVQIDASQSGWSQCGKY